MPHNGAMNYDHAFHAGNHADVLKHLVLLTLIDALARTPAPFFVLDTHAGRGDYALDSSAAQATGEAALGVRRLHDWSLAQPLLAPALARYLRAVRPALEARRYRSLFARDPRVGIHQRDGYAALKALLPPKEKRGLVLIDPPYEAQLAEFDQVIDALKEGLARWPQGIFALWYPIKQRRALAPFYRRAAALPARSALVAELMRHADDSPLRLNGSGMLVLNPPWKLDESLLGALPQMGRALGETHDPWRLDWLRREST